MLILKIKYLGGGPILEILRKKYVNTQLRGDHTDKSNFCL